MTNGIDFGHDLDLGFSRSNKEFAGVRIYQIVTGVTSDVSMPLIHLVGNCKTYQTKIPVACQTSTDPSLKKIFCCHVKSPHWQMSQSEYSNILGIHFHLRPVLAFELCVCVLRGGS